MFSNALLFANEKTIIHRYVLATGGNLENYQIADSKIQSSHKLLDSKKWSYITGPSYDTKNGCIYFEARKNGRSPLIYFFHFADKDRIPKQLIKGRYPAISPDSKFLSYYVHPNQLWILNLKTKESKKAGSEMLNRQPAVWISNHSLLYATTYKNLRCFNTISGQNTRMADQMNEVIPGALSPNAEQVICGSYDGTKIYLYTLENKELKIIKKSRFLSLGTNFVWSVDGKGFLFTRQTWSNSLRFNESQDLFYWSLTGNEIHLSEKVALFGGVAIQ
jgi:hypothetical protein